MFKVHFWYIPLFLLTLSACAKVELKEKFPHEKFAFGNLTSLVDLKDSNFATLEDDGVTLLLSKKHERLYLKDLVPVEQGSIYEISVKYELLQDADDYEGWSMDIMSLSYNKDGMPTSSRNHSIAIIDVPTKNGNVFHAKAKFALENEDNRITKITDNADTRFIKVSTNPMRFALKGKRYPKNTKVKVTYFSISRMERSD